MVRFLEREKSSMKIPGVADVSKIDPAHIDAMLIQLRTGMKVMPGIPEDVLKSGTEFCNALDRWSDKLKKEEGN